MAFKLHASALLLALGGCASAPRFPLQPPLTRDADEAPFAQAPAEYYSPFAWDGANYMVFHPIARFFAVDPAGAATNVNALDEVPDSSWFENRLGARAMSAADVEKGSCDKFLDPNGADGSWTIDKGKDNGANPGFRVNIKGLGKFMLKTDPETEPDRATGATAIASRIYHAVGYHSACDSVVYFRPSLLKLEPGLTVTNNQGVTRPFDQARLDEILKQASHRDGLVRMVASAWLPGKPIGPYRYEGTRDDDPNDVIPHEDRREVRGGRLLAAWLNHFDSREQNTMDVFLPLDKEKKDGPGFVRHYIIDMGDCFGSQWSVDGISRRLGSSYVFDAGHVAEDFLSLGITRRPWERAQLTGGLFGYFSARDFDPEAWRGEYPNPAFMRMTEQDGAWMARILAHFDDDLLRAAVKVGKFDTVSERYLSETLIARRRAILRRYLGKVSPIARVRTNLAGVCGVDLARLTRTVPNEGLSFRAYVYRGPRLEAASKPRFRGVPTPEVCLDIEHADLPASLPQNDPARYVVVDITNGYAPGPLRVHLYDLGADGGYQLAGIERPSELKHPG